MQHESGGKPHLRLNTHERPIAYKYREGKLKRTLEKELKEPEIAEAQAFLLHGVFLRHERNSAVERARLETRTKESGA